MRLVGFELSHQRALPQETGPSTAALQRMCVGADALLVGALIEPPLTLGPVVPAATRLGGRTGGRTGGALAVAVAVGVAVEATVALVVGMGVVVETGATPAVSAVPGAASTAPMVGRLPSASSVFGLAALRHHIEPIVTKTAAEVTPSKRIPLRRGGAAMRVFAGTAFTDAVSTVGASEEREGGASRSRVC